MAQRKKKRRRAKFRHDPRRADAHAQREEARQRQAEDRRQEAISTERREKWTGWLKKAAGPALIGLAVMTVALLLFRGEPEVADVVKVSEIEAVELAADQEGEYDTATPTSGQYTPGDPVCQVSTEKMALPDAVAAQRVGAVVLWYRPDASQATIDMLAGLQAEFGEVMVSPNDGIEQPVVATAWTRLKRFTEPDEAEVRDFVDTYLDRGPVEGSC